MDGVNRDIEFEKDFFRYRQSPKGDSTRMDAIWSVWSILRMRDLKAIRISQYKTITACLKLAELHFRMDETEMPYFEYVKWFTYNRILTGPNGTARCQRSTLFKHHPEGAFKEHKKETSK